MAALKTNRVIPMMVLTFVIMAALVFYKASQPSGAKPLVVESGQWMRRAPTPRTSDADTSNDTIRAIRGEVTEATSTTQETLAMNSKLIKQLDEVIAEKVEIEQNQQSVVDQQLAVQAAQNQRQFELMMGRMSEMVDKIGDVDIAGPMMQASTNDKQATQTNAPMEIPDGFGLHIEAGQFVSGEDLIEVFWIEPLDESINTRVGGSTTLSLKAQVGHTADTLTDRGDGAKALLMKPLDTYRELVDSAADKPGLIDRTQQLVNPTARKMSGKPIPEIVEIEASWRGGSGQRQSTRVNRPGDEPFYTIPDLSVLSGAVATTSLVGRIYPDGNVVDPQYFKLIVGRDNFTANYHALPPEIEGMIFEGYGIGDFTTRCVSGRLIAATFVFEDGTTRSMYPGDPGTRPNSRDSLGYITDPFGNPCISGKLITDAREFFATGSALAFASAYAGALRESQTTTVQSFDTTDGITGNTLTEVTGDINDYALASGLSAGIDRGSRWLDEMFKNSQSLIYAPSGRRVDIHLQQELRVDIAKNARKIRVRKHARHQNELD